MTNLYKSIDANVDVGNKTGVHYDSARLVRILVIFEPVEPVDEDLDRVLIPTEEQSSDPDLNQLGVLLAVLRKAHAWLSKPTEDVYRGRVYPPEYYQTRQY